MKGIEMSENKKMNYCRFYKFAKKVFPNLVCSKKQVSPGYYSPVTAMEYEPEYKNCYFLRSSIGENNPCPDYEEKTGFFALIDRIFYKLWE